MTALVPPDLIPNWIPGEKTADSSHLGWSGLTLKGYHYPDQEVNIPSMRDSRPISAQASSHRHGTYLSVTPSYRIGGKAPPILEIGVRLPAKKAPKLSRAATRPTIPPQRGRWESRP